MSKKLVAFAIVVAMMFSMMTSFVTTASAANTVASDVTGTQYEEAAYLLGALSIMVGDKDTGAFRPDDTIIRSEFAKVAVAMTGLNDVATNSTKATRFPDVVANHWATGFINVADTQKYVIGDDQGNFRPDDKITFAEAVTVIVRALGYEPQALENGAFPTGYLVTAAQIGLLNGISQDANTEATRGTVAKLVYNALTIDKMERIGFGTDETYQVSDKTLLEDNLDVVQKYGQITANTESSFVGQASLRDDEVQIATDDGNTDIYKVGNTAARQYLGYNVVLYSKEVKNTTDKILVLVRPDASKMSEMKITSDNLQGITGNASSKKVISYWVNKETDRTPKKVNVSSTAKVFYNGVATTDYAVEDLMNVMTNGYITMLDTNKDDEYDMVFITKYTNYVVDDVSLTSYKISDKGTNPALTLDPTDKDVKFTITKDGQPIELKDLKENDILSVSMSGTTPDNSRVINVIVTDKTVSGKITEISDNKYTIDGQEYKLAENMENEFSLGLQDEGTFYLNAEGKIAWYDNATTNSDNYSFLVAGVMSDSIDQTLQLKVFTKDGETKVINGADKIRFNREGTFTDAQILAKLAGTADSNYAGISNVAQLITYEVNSAGEIVAINTARDNTSNMSELKDIFSKDVAADGLVYKDASRQLGKYNVNNNTIIFDIPQTSVGTDTQDFAIRTMSMFTDKNGYDASIYDLSADLTVAAMIVMNSDGNTNSESPIAVVDKLSTTKNDQDTEVQKLYAIVDGKSVQVLAKDSATLYEADGQTLLQQGDIIQYSLNAKGEIDKVNVLFQAADKADPSKFVTTTQENGDVQLVYGTVNKKFSGSINVQTQDGIANYATGNAIVYNYDASKSSNQVTIADASQIQRYDSADPRAVFVRIYKNQVKEIVIVKLPQDIQL